VEIILKNIRPVAIRNFRNRNTEYFKEKINELEVHSKNKISETYVRHK